MEIPDVVSVRKFKEFNAAKKEEVYETLVDLAQAVDALPKKSLRKTLDITLAVLEYKGEQAVQLQTQLQRKVEREGEHSEDSQIERLLDENEKLKRMLDRLEDEKGALKGKTKELTEEIFALQKRLQEAMQTAEGSDKDSSDPLSELDKQEELLRSINMKNKHIKRLLKEIEALQTQNIEQSKIIITAERELQQAKTKELQLSADITLVNSERKALKETVNELRLELTRLEGNITYLEEERERSELELKDFIERLELKAQSWKSLLDQKDAELKKLHVRLERDGDMMSSPETANKRDTEALTQAAEDEDEMSADATKMLHAIEARDKLIEQLETKIKTMAEEMLSSTKLMNRLSAEKEEERNPQKPRTCCKVTEGALQAANDRCRELTEMLEHAEEDNALKAKQALEAISALNAYESGEVGLVKALRKCSSLEQKIMSRDKQVRNLITELNSMHEIAQENGILRKRLNIPDDEVICVKYAAVKERQKEKIIERLTLKLRASEEMRIQLKLEKSDLRKELLQLQKALQKPVEMQEIAGETSSGPSEIGEVEDSLPAEIHAEEVNDVVCKKCKRKIYISESEEAVSKQESLDQQLLKYQDVCEENETLRVGMHEILERLRDYDDCSDHITIDTDMLYRLLQVLQKHSPNGTPHHLQLEVESLKQRERALREFLHGEPQPTDTETDELESVGEMREDPTLQNMTDENALPIPSFVDSSTRPTTPSRSYLHQISIPIISEENAIEHLRDSELQVTELKVYRKYYEELKIHVGADEMELTTYCAKLVEQVRHLETELKAKSCRYDFMQQDFDKALTQNKQIQLQHMQLVAELSRELKQQQQLVARLEEEQQLRAQQLTYSVDEYEALLKQNAMLQSQLAHTVAEVFRGEVLPDLKPDDICADYGIIDANLQLNYMTAEEYERQRTELNECAGKQEEMLRNSMQLEGLLEIAREQIQSQQKLLNEITDNHINLRHLVADLQSSSEDKLLLAKMQRDLDSAKMELETLKTVRTDLQHKQEYLESQLNHEQLNTANLKRNFQRDLQNRNIKIKFLQKALYALQEKYSKFTPLIFLTNFVFAYTKFVRKSKDTDIALRDETLLENIHKFVEAQLEAHQCNGDESENLIKLVKAETHCKMVEAKNEKLETKCKSLEEELIEQRIRMATETEHWQTIQALFGTVADNVAVTVAQNAVVQSQHVTTNTEEEVPVPAQRKNSPTPKDRTESTVQMVDKNTSPISSPTRMKPNQDQETQTEGDSRIEGTESTVEVTKHIEDKLDHQSLAEEPQISHTPAQATVEPITSASIRTMDVLIQTEDVNEPVTNDLLKTIELRLEEMRHTAASREELLLQTQEQLLNANGQIEKLERLLDSARTNSQEVDTMEPTETQDRNSQAGVIEKTIVSFHTLLTEKDKSISKYQDLLQSEREQMRISMAQLNTEVLDLKNTISNLNFNIKTKDMEILELKTQLETVFIRRNSNEKLALATTAADGDENGDNSLNELTDEKIEEMFQQDGTGEGLPRIVVTSATAVHNSGQQQRIEEQGNDEVPALLKQLKQLKDMTSMLEHSLRLKQDELQLLRSKVTLYEQREKSAEQLINPEVEQLRLLLEDKDKHVNELMETLNNFHDDQQRFIADSSNDSADRISKLAGNLTRCEATNKIYQTQVEALRRQLNSVTQREKQARELCQSLRTQLIKRPVVSIKTELNARVRQEQLQKRMQQLELELEDAQVQIRRQQTVIDTKKARSASEVNLWEKQKRWQQNAEKFKAKLEETETALEKTRALLQTARNNIARLEKDKQALEVRLGRVVQCGSGSSETAGAISAGRRRTQGINKCCRTPSCPNLQQNSSGATAAMPMGKYTPSESPETYTGASSENSSPTHSAPATCGNRGYAQGVSFYGANRAHEHPHEELIEALKARIELQQRKIVALELEGKGSNALITEMERIQERCTEIEAQNIRLEAKNLQLQLDIDLLRQGDATDRLQKRIKHLEDYIIALKEERAQIEARRELCKCNSLKVSAQPNQSAEQTILSLRRIVEKLRAENKYLKDGRRSCESRSSASGTPPTELSKLQQMYTEALDKINALQIELNVKAKCTKCGNCGQLDTHLNDELKYIKEQLIKKTQLLQKAKVLLTRAAAKEKVLKEQLALWKRKCSELQNVPVIDEISE